ncbi:MAG: hypothetical protein COZ02_11160 [Zetaproteobacteria bacterium CG_4_10_14_0_8_um_filter_59_127]|nr:MAG: hypothetical protein COZ02_11160 [Zetaproteobacteria bacterium CG_4_10_14_0_8_um_filter_59_127]
MLTGCMQIVSRSQSVPDHSIERTHIILWDYIALFYSGLQFSMYCLLAVCEASSTEHPEIDRAGQNKVFV